MLQSDSVTRVKISPELRARLDSVIDSQLRCIRYTPEVDAAILEYWPKKNKVALAKALGVGAGQLRARYKELTDDAKASD